MVKKIKTEEAVGLPLLHDITSIQENGFKGVLFKRNHIIEHSDIEKLKDVGKEHIYVGELEENEVHEEDAVMCIAERLAGDNISYSGPSEGKLSFKSKVKGLFVVDEEGLLELNSVPDYTVACIKNYSRVGEGDLLFGARIVPFFTDRANVDAAMRAVEKSESIFKVIPFSKKSIGIIITGNEIFSGRIKDRFEPMIREKLQDYNAEITDLSFASDDMELMMKKINDLFEKAPDIVMMSGGMSVDPDDLTPTVIRKACDRLIFQGLPIQPGNMLTVGEKLLKDKTCYVVGVPGASIHSPFTSLDLLLPRLFADMPIVHEDFKKMAVGGIL